MCICKLKQEGFTMPTQIQNIKTKDGVCSCHIVTSEKGGGGPAILFYHDAGGIRPAILEMAQNLANAGYVVFVPDLFYRFGPYGPLVPADVFAGDAAAVLGPLMATTGNAISAQDLALLLGIIDDCAAVHGNKVGAIGFCMGGGMAITAAAECPERIAAVASFHGGGLATNAHDSPHLRVPKLKAELYIAAATDDHFYPRDMAIMFEAALTDASIMFKAETYPAAHGWMKPDFPVYDDAQAARGWSEVIALFDRVLKE
jgi:carboxymethylenebutenolidase